MYMKPSHKTVYTMDIKMAQRVLLAHRQLRWRATDAAQDLCFLPKTV